MAYQVVSGVDYKLMDDDYRKNFLDKNPPEVDLKGNQYYVCAYCGRHIKLSEMQVDHILPKTRLKAGILWNPNKEWNLIESCGPCNVEKSNYIDKRVLIGYVRKYTKLNLLKILSGSKRKESKLLTSILSLVVSLLFIVWYLVGQFVTSIFGGVSYLTVSIYSVITRLVKVCIYRVYSYKDYIMWSKTYTSTDCEFNE